MHSPTIVRSVVCFYRNLLAFALKHKRVGRARVQALELESARLVRDVICGEFDPLQRLLGILDLPGVQVPPVPPVQDVPQHLLPTSRSLRKSGIKTQPYGCKGRDLLSESKLKSFGLDSTGNTWEDHAVKSRHTSTRHHNEFIPSACSFKSRDQINIAHPYSGPRLRCLRNRQHPTHTCTSLRLWPLFPKTSDLQDD